MDNFDQEPQGWFATGNTGPTPDSGAVPASQPDPNHSWFAPNAPPSASKPGMTSWLQDLENHLWGNGGAVLRGNGGAVLEASGEAAEASPPPAQRDGPSGPSTASADEGEDVRPETVDYLRRLAGIGTPAYLHMLSLQEPGYRDWRDQNFAPLGSGAFLSYGAQLYTQPELRQMHGLLSQQAGNPLISALFKGPKSRIADFMTWKNQNFVQNQGTYQDEDGTPYSHPQLENMFAAKFQAPARGSSGGAVGSTDDQAPQPTQARFGNPVQEDDATGGPRQQDETELLAQNTGQQNGPLTSQSGQASANASATNQQAQPEHGEGSKTNLAKRADIAQRALGYDKSTHWGFYIDRSDEGFGPGSNKCNVFVYDLLKEAGAEARAPGRKNWPMPVAEEWANPKFKIPNWRVLRPDETPQPGDVAAFPMHDHPPGAAPYTGHSGIIVADKDGKTGSMSAHDFRVGPISYDQFLHEDQQRQPTVVFRRYTGD